MLDTLAVINRRPDIGRKSPFLPHLGGPHHNIAIMHGMEKLQWCGYPMVKKLEDMFTRFDRIHERDGQTPHDSIGHIYA